MKKLLQFLLILGITTAYAQNDSSLQVVFYNVENLFDTIDQPDVKDEEYTPDSEKDWNSEKMNFKIENIAKTVVGAAGWNRPDLIGLCELENRFVLDLVAQNSAFDGLEMDIAHFESPDRRGIDVGLLYSTKSLTLKHSEPLLIHFDFDSTLTTRDVLYAKFGINALTKDNKRIGNGRAELHVFVCHWPSRWGGKEASEPKRLAAAAVLRSTVDSIQAIIPDAQILIMGDMNDHPSDPSIVETLGARTDTAEILNVGLYALMNLELNFEGSHRYYGEWSFLDQFVISGSLIAQPIPSLLDVRVYNAEHLLEEDIRYPGVMPYRTYGGPHYKGGFSDHLPIVLEIRTK